MTNMARFYIDHMALGVFNGLTIVTIITYLKKVYLQVGWMTGK